jgi:hypothetical protein
MRTLTLSPSANVTLDSNGDGTAQLGPRSAGEIWYPELVSVTVSEPSITSQAQCQIYCGPDTSAAFLVDGTLSGSTGDATGKIAGQVVRPGSWIWAVWSNGDPGATAIMTIQGTRTVP